MHSRVFCIARNEEDKEFLEDVLDEEFIYNEMSGIADYTEDSDLEDDLEWLVELSCYKNIFRAENNKLKINKECLEQYILDKIYNIKKIIEEISTPSEYLSLEYKLKTSINDKFGFYVYEPNALYTMDEFLNYIYRYELDSVENLEFEVVKTFDYHS